MCDLETSRIGVPYIYDISHLRVKMGLKKRDWEEGMDYGGGVCYSTLIWLRIRAVGLLL
jgi:hypothetical protein